MFSIGVSHPLSAEDQGCWIIIIILGVSPIGNPSRLAFDRSTTRTDNIDAVAEEWLLLIL